MNKIGFNVLAWSAGMSDDLLPILDRLKAIGYDGAEFFVGDADEKAFKKIGKHANAIGLETTTVFVLSGEENPIDPDPKIRQKALDRIKWTIDRSNLLHSKVICGPFHSAFATFRQHAPEEQEYQWSAEILHQAGEYASQFGITLTPEALNRFECYLCNTTEQLAHLVKLTDHPNVLAMYDTHHANIEEKDIVKSIKTIATYLKHFHISENDRGTPGEGHVHWDDTFSTLAEIGYDGWLTIEGFTRNDVDFANSINVWREYAKPWDMAEKGLEFIKMMLSKYSMN
ncbi:MAG: sugar phosphate isomerase/epimerase family protein [Bacteroidota bacterium]